MPERQDVEMTPETVAKTKRSRVRLVYSLAAGDEINEVLPTKRKEFCEALARLAPKELSADQSVSVRSAATSASRSAPSL